MATLNDIIATSDQFQALSVLTGVAVGTAMELQVKGIYPVLLKNQDTQPADDDTNGRVLYDLRTESGVIKISAGSEEVWLRCLKEGSTSKISVEVL